MEKQNTSSRLIIVAHRLPFQYNKQSRSMQRSSGGLVSSLVSYLERNGHATSPGSQKTIWIGASDLSEKKYNELDPTALEKDAYFESQPVFLPETIKAPFYQGFCNDCIWPLFHYFPSYARYVHRHYQAYKAANNYFLDKLMQVYRPGDKVWIHDYHLMLLPGLLRERVPEANIGFFLHIPFPSFEVFRIMPNNWKKELMDGLLGADLIGFHTGDYLQYFLRCVQQLTNYEINGRKVHCFDRTVTTDAFPVSIDFNKFYHASDAREVFEEKNMIKKKMNGRHLVLSVDRLDYSKALVNRLESFECFLERNKQYRGKVTYMMLVVPSREIITKYKENKQEIERLIGNINGKYATLDWVPVLYQYKSVDFKRLTGLYFAADVALITPLRDGMNLVAKEFVSTRIDKRGVLILSDTTGAAAELKQALIVNPSDREEIAQAILTALEMPVEEQVSRNESMLARLRSYDVVKWADDFITQLVLQHRLQTSLREKRLNDQLHRQLLEDYQQATKRLLLLDYDGTLCALVKRPELAVPDKTLTHMLSALAADPKNNLVLVSGRKRTDLEEWFGALAVGLVAEHGAFYKKAGGNWQRASLANASWKEQVREVMMYYHSRCAGSMVEEKDLSMTWHYRNADKDLGAIRARELVSELTALETEANLQVMQGHLVVEVRNRHIHKGSAVQRWLQEQRSDFVFCAGDDRTDEDMFRALPASANSLRIGLVKTEARYNCSTRDEFMALMRAFSQQWQQKALTEMV